MRLVEVHANWPKHPRLSKHKKCWLLGLWLGGVSSFRYRISFAVTFYEVPSKDLFEVLLEPLHSLL